MDKDIYTFSIYIVYRRLSVCLFVHNSSIFFVSFLLLLSRSIARLIVYCARAFDHTETMSTVSLNDTGGYSVGFAFRFCKTFQMAKMDKIPTFRYYIYLSNIVGMNVGSILQLQSEPTRIWIYSRCLSQSLSLNGITTQFYFLSFVFSGLFAFATPVRRRLSHGDIAYFVRRNKTHNTKHWIMQRFLD